MNIAFLIVREISSSSMPWEDLYCNFKSSNTKFPSINISPPMVITRKLFGRVEKHRVCANGVEGRYYECGIGSSINHLIRFYLSNRKRYKRFILHLHSPVLLLLFLPLKGIGFKVVFNIHNSPERYGFLNKIFLNLFAKNADRLIAVSHINSKIAEYKYSTPVCAIRNSLATPIVPFTKKRNKSHPITVVVIARFVEQKNIFFTLDILSKMEGSFEINWYGEGPLYKRAISYAEKKGVFINFHGLVDRNIIYEKLSRSDIYLLCSRWEGIGVSTIEAAYFGCYCLVSDIPPHRELSSLSNNLIKTISLDDMGEWLTEIANYSLFSKVRIEQYRKDINKVIRDRFSNSVMLSSYSEVYDSL